jgi:hypothetical protein
VTTVKCYIGNIGLFSSYIIVLLPLLLEFGVRKHLQCDAIRTVNTKIAIGSLFLSLLPPATPLARADMPRGKS